MYFNHFYRRRKWQIFIIGLVSGSFVAYFIMLYMYGTMYEKILTENISYQTQLIELQRKNEVLQFDLAENEMFTINSIKVYLVNEKELKLDQLTVYELKHFINTENQFIIGKKMTTIAEMDDLIVRTIENKPIKMDELTYQFTVKRLMITDELILHLEVKTIN